MILFDASPLVFLPRSGVARACGQLLAGWQELFGGEAPQTYRPHPGMRPREARRALRDEAARLGAAGLYVPWSAFPAVDVPVVACVHELPFVRHGSLEGAWRGWRHRHWLARNVRSCAAIVVPSSATREDLLALHPEAEERVFVVSNGFDPTPWLRVEAMSHPRPYVVMVGLGQAGWGARKKGLDILLEAWQEHAPEGHDLVLIGRTSMRLPPGVVQHHDLPEAELRRWVAGAACLVYPSRSEGFGYPPLEAMAAGVPVLATHAGAIPETVGRAAHLVPAGSVDALGRGLQQVLGDQALRRRLRHAGLRQAEGFSPRESALRLRRIFEALGVAA